MEIRSYDVLTLGLVVEGMDGDDFEDLYEELLVVAFDKHMIFQGSGHSSYFYCDAEYSNVISSVLRSLICVDLKML